MASRHLRRAREPLVVWAGLSSISQASVFAIIPVVSADGFVGLLVSRDPRPPRVLFFGRLVTRPSVYSSCGRLLHPGNLSLPRGCTGRTLCFITPRSYQAFPSDVTDTGDGREGMRTMLADRQAESWRRVSKSQIVSSHQEGLPSAFVNPVYFFLYQGDRTTNYWS